MRSNKRRLLALATASALLFAACGAGQDESSEVVAAAAPETESVAGAAVETDEPAATTAPVTAAPATAEPATEPTTAEPATGETVAIAEPEPGPATAVPQASEVQDDAPLVEVDDATAEAAADLNLAAIEAQDATGLADFQVLDVADGSIATLQEAVTGDLPVLLWFFSPH